MIRIHFTAADFARVRFAPRPSPLQELNATLVMMGRPHDELLYGRWRRRLLQSLPDGSAPLKDLAPTHEAPGFLNVVDDTLQGGIESMRGSRPELVRSGLEQLYPTRSAPAWIRDLYRGDAHAWQLLRRAQRLAFDAALRPVWPLVEDLHQAEFTRHALTVAEHGIGATLTGLFPSSWPQEDIWELRVPGNQDIKLDGHGILLMPTFHLTGPPCLSHVPERPLVLKYPAGPGLPLTPDGVGSAEEALAEVLGRTRFGILLLLADEHTTGGLARRLEVSNATVSAHTAALRGSGLITTVRAGRAVLHRRTALGDLLIRRHTEAPPAAALTAPAPRRHPAAEGGSRLRPPPLPRRP
ncbi:ArsR/SmtB family transcription factor [Streptomyces sp. NPDC001985]|uniref:ArsR/SmtB family transcription factor n=1 Tax=Streptomyces sp. NPDC001985 TaxID=3154406 RepID=UPI003322686A